MVGDTHAHTHAYTHTGCVHAVAFEGHASTLVALKRLGLHEPGIPDCQVGG